MTDKAAGSVARGRYGKRKKRRYKNNAGILLVTVVMICFAAVMGFRMKSLRVEAKDYASQVTALQQELEEEEQRAEDLEESRAYVQTRQYIEDIAREKLNLVYPDETVVRPEE